MATSNEVISSHRSKKEILFIKRVICINESVVYEK